MNQCPLYTHLQPCLIARMSNTDVLLQPLPHSQTHLSVCMDSSRLLSYLNENMSASIWDSHGKVSKQTMVRIEWQVTHRDLHSGVCESKRQWCFRKPNHFNIVRKAFREDSFEWCWTVPCASVWGSKKCDSEASLFDDLGWERSASPGSVCVPSIIQVVYLMVLSYNDVLQASLTWSYFLF